MRKSQMSMTDYETFFNLKAKPFELVPNPEYLYLSRTHRKAMTYLEYGITERAGFILLTGEVGSGKTTLIRNLIRKLDRKVALSKVFNTKVNSEQLISLINDDFGLDVKGKDKAALLKDLYDFLIDRYANGYHCVLIIDEAQNLDSELLEEVRMLSNLETDSSKLLQIVLAGQPELKRMLSTSELRQLRQRINISCHLYHLLRDETEEYILHRLEVAGNRAAVTFSPEAIDVIFRYSRGVPRLINIICDFLMLSAFVEKTRQIDSKLAGDIVKDLEIDNWYWDFEKEGCAETGASEQSVQAEAPADTQAEEVKVLFEDVCRRLDAIEKRAPVHSMVTPRELEKRMERLEKLISMSMESGEKKSGPPADDGRQPRQGVEPSGPAANQTAKTEKAVEKKGLFGRILGF